MQLSRRALFFIMRAYGSDKRLVHSLLVGMILKSYGYKDYIVAAGYLHDVSTDTCFGINDIGRLFGGNVASLVMTPIRVDSSLEWQEHANQTLKIIRNLPIANMAIICADLIANLEDLKMRFSKQGYAEFDVDVSSMYDYYTKICKILSETLDSPLSDRLRDVINDLFGNVENYGVDKYPQDIVSESISPVESLRDLKNTIMAEYKPYIISFVGMPCEKRPSFATIIKKFLYDADYRFRVCDDTKQGNRFEQTYINVPGISRDDVYLLISSVIEGNLKECVIDDKNMVVASSGLFEILALIKMFFDLQILDEVTLDSYLNCYADDIGFLVSVAGVDYTSLDNSMTPQNNIVALKELKNLITGTSGDDSSIPPHATISTQAVKNLSRVAARPSSNIDKTAA